MDELSDTESLTGSLASVSMLDDDQVHCLMLETEDFAAEVLYGIEPVSITNSKPLLKTLPCKTGVTSIAETEEITTEQTLIVETSNRLQELVEKCLLVDEVIEKNQYKLEK